ncbi:MAG: ASKHA domain-containing protein [Planctomycetaceae bacterium]|nr:ASKHA domain-containing protein [Planctomycetaceae bacterium]
MNFYFVRFCLETEPYLIRAVYAEEGTVLKTAAEKLGYHLNTNCGNSGTCGKCRVIADGKEVPACQALVEDYEKLVIPVSSIRKDENKAAVVTGSFAGKVPKPAGKRKGHRYGVAVDIGTTTLAAELQHIDGDAEPVQASRANPQRQFGDDVLSRIQKLMDDPAALTAMQQLVVGAINEMIAEVAEKADITPKDITLVTAAGNSVMQLLLHGIDPAPLGVVPFQPPVKEFPPRSASEAGLNIAADGMLETLPLFGGFVGGDIVAGVLTLHSINPKIADTTAFFVDIGTNGELVLFHRGKIYTAATAAGPAFEGAGIECGTLAVPGAIDRVSIKDGKVCISTIDKAKAVGICGSGLIDAVAVLLDNGLLKSNGQMQIPDKKNFELVPAAQSGTGKAVCLTQRDIRQVQLAAGAIRAGMTLLLETAEITAKDLEAFYLAGGFGQFVDASAAQRVGLIPKDVPLKRLQVCGNTSLAGAVLLLLDPEYAQTAKQYIAESQNIELAKLKRFSEVFAGSMNF